MICNRLQMDIDLAIRHIHRDQQHTELVPIDCVLETYANQPLIFNENHFVHDNPTLASGREASLCSHFMSLDLRRTDACGNRSDSSRLSS